MKCSKILSFEALPAKEKSEDDVDPIIFGLGSNDAARKMLDNAGIEQMETGMVVGVTAILMNEGRWRTLVGGVQSIIP